ncbi:MAG: hypothetical protein AB1Z98_01700 [Nannocystaceae bacterium]
MTKHASLFLSGLMTLGCGDEPETANDTDATTTEASSSSSAAIADDTSSGLDGSGSGSSSSTTGPMPCTMDEECTEPEAPFCGTEGECGTCDQTVDGDMACAGADELLPLCVGEACVACRDGATEACDTQLLVCDVETNTCVPCSEHDDCAVGACELSVGRCFPSDSVQVAVDGDGGQDETSLVAALGMVPDGGYGVIRMHELDLANPYTGGLLVDGGKTIALLAAPDESPIIQGTGGNPGVRVEAAGTILYADGLSIAGNTGGLGVNIDEAFAWVDRSRIVQNSGGGILASNGAELTVRNCFVGGSVNGVSALDIDGSAATLSYSTVIAGFGGAAVALSCSPGSTVGVADSIVLIESANEPVSCAEATFDRSASEVDLPGATNVNVGSFDDTSTWFVNVSGGDFSLTTSGDETFIDIAQWNEGDSSTDIDGDPRPTTDGAPDYAGADVPR